MANFANIVVKNAANVDVTYVATSRSPGDGISAVWTDTRNPVGIFRPTFKVSCKDNGTGTARRVSWEHRVPELTEQMDNTFIVRDTIISSGTRVVPLRISEEKLNDAAVITANLLEAPLLIDILSTGFNAV